MSQGKTTDFVFYETFRVLYVSKQRLLFFEDCKNCMSGTDVNKNTKEK